MTVLTRTMSKPRGRIRYDMALCLIFPLLGMASCRSTSPLQVSVCDPVQLIHRDSDICGLKLNLPYGRNENVMGIDAGVFGHVDDEMIGIQVNLLASSAKRVNGIQVGYCPVTIAKAEAVNGLQAAAGFVAATYAAEVEGIQMSLGVPLSANIATNCVTGLQILLLGANVVSEELMGAQVSLLINLAGDVTGAQAGFVNVSSGDVTGLQLGVINICRRLAGLQIGVLKLSADHKCPFLPVLNARF